MKDFGLFLAILMGTALLEGTAAVTMIECQDGKISGINELVKSVEDTVEECTNSTSSKADLFACIFKKMDFFDDTGVPAADKVKGFFQRIFSSKTMTEATDLTKNLIACAENYAQSFTHGKSAKDLGDAGSAFANCFFDATKKFTSFIRKTCKPIEMTMEGTTQEPK